MYHCCVLIIVSLLRLTYQLFSISTVDGYCCYWYHSFSWLLHGSVIVVSVNEQQLPRLIPLLKRAKECIHTLGEMSNRENLLSCFFFYISYITARQCARCKLRSSWNTYIKYTTKIIDVLIWKLIRKTFMKEKGINDLFMSK